jgi:peptidoglycan-associated lipoprotein
MMRRNWVAFGLIALVLCFSVAFLTGCAKKAALKEGAVVSQEQKAVSQAAGTDDAAARERALREQALKEQAQKEAAASEAAKEVTAKQAAETAKREEAAQVADILKVLQIPDVHFDYDKYNLKPEAQEILKKGAPAYLKYRNYRLVVEGHCDERGTNEYNLALGEKRAMEAANYLFNLGVEKERIKTISYGEEMPLDKGHDEAAWTKNRRAHFVVFPPAK